MLFEFGLYLLLCLKNLNKLRMNFRIMVPRNINNNFSEIAANINLAIKVLTLVIWTIIILLRFCVNVELRISQPHHLQAENRF